MEFISVGSDSLEESVDLFERYYEYLESVKERMPREAYSFAAADWHYDHYDPRCPHDAWVEELLPTGFSAQNSICNGAIIRLLRLARTS